MDGTGTTGTAEAARAAESLFARIQELDEEASLRSAAHWVRARRWGAVALWTSWASAFAATIGTVTIIGNRQLVAGALAIVTAGLSTFLATIKPADHAAAHKAAGVGFEAVGEAMQDLGRDLGDGSTVEYVGSDGADAPAYARVVSAKPSAVRAVRAGFEAERARYDALKVRAPALAQDRSHARHRRAPVMPWARRWTGPAAA